MIKANSMRYDNFYLFVLSLNGKSWQILMIKRMKNTHILLTS